MRHFTVLFLLVLFPVATSAQGSGSISGTVAAESGQPLSGASVTVRRATGDSAAVGRAAAGANGRFQVLELQPGSYVVEISLLGYATARRANVTIPSAAPTVDLGTIRLAASAVAIEGLEVVSERSAVRTAPDRTIYSTQEMPIASGGVATDVLRSVPELEVDINGGVQLRGTAARVYLNGRPAPMEGEALDLFLQQLPADRIDRVEVIANPSARFEAEGAGGIVNVVLKQDVNLGLSGSTFVNGSTRGEAGLGGRLAYQRGRVSVHGGGFLRRSDRRTTTYDLRQNLLTDPDTYLEQDAWSEREGLSGSVDVTGELKLGQRSTAWSRARVFHNGFDADGITVYTEMDDEQAALEVYDRAELDESHRLRTDLSAGYRYAIKPDRHEVTVEVEYQGGWEDEARQIRRRTLALSGEPAGLPVELTWDNSDENEAEVELQVDYTRPWSETGRFEVGYRTALSDSDESRLLQVSADENVESPGITAARAFGFREVFHSAYVTASRKFGPLGAQVGVRAERASTRLELPADASIFENDYVSFFPSANLLYELGGGPQVRLSYSQRIRRPQPWVLNPVNQSSDPLNRRVGNPELDPQYTHSLSLETSWTGQLGSLRFSPYYRRTVDDWTQIKTVDAEGVSTVRWENLASVESYGTSLTASVRPIGGVSGFASVSGHREARDASNLSLDYSGSSLRWSARSNVSARVGRSLDLQGMLSYRPARDVPQGRISSSLMSHVGLRHQFSSRRGSVNLMVTDPLDLYRSSFETRDPTHIQIGQSRWSARSAVLSFSYSFGRPPRGRQEEVEEQPEDLIR